MTATIDKRTLGSTGTVVTRLGFGAMELRGGIRGRQTSEGSVDRLLNRALDLGVNFIDTSIDYGKSEERIGSALHHRRDEYFLATKCGCVVGWEPSDDTPGPGPHDYRPENIIAGVEQSLRRLRTDHIDLMQVHGSPAMSELVQHGTVEVLESLRAEGKLRHIGISGTLPHLSEHIASGRFATYQVPYSLVQREHEPLMERAMDIGGGVIVRGGVAKGAPAGKRTPGVTSGPKAALESAWGQVDLGDLYEGMSAMEFALRFTLSHSAVDTAIVGTLSERHLEDNVAAAQRGPLPEEVYLAARRRLEAAVPPEPRG